MELSGPEKAVLMLLSLDEATATPILSEMDEGDVRKLREAASNMRAVPATALELVYAELLGVLERAGLERMQALDAPFDPNEHEAVMQEDGDGEGEPRVGGVLRTGWKLKGRVLRPAMVKVSR